MFKFKDVEVTFDMKQLPFYDQEYLKTMCYETVNAKSFLHSGKSFNELFKGANNFTIFDDDSTMHGYMSEFAGKVANTASHLLHGKKYYFAWTYKK
jgi:hypothetical protein